MAETVCSGVRPTQTKGWEVWVAVLLRTGRFKTKQEASTMAKLGICKHPAVQCINLLTLIYMVLQFITFMGYFRIYIQASLINVNPQFQSLPEKSVIFQTSISPKPHHVPNLIVLSPPHTTKFPRVRAIFTAFSSFVTCKPKYSRVRRANDKRARIGKFAHACNLQN